jgi:tRNA(adenine34) deaminase
VDAAQVWAALGEPWRVAFDQAWEGFWAGNPPVGAVVVDAAGKIVTAARSRRFDSSAPPGQLAGTNLAHAEVNALAGLAPGKYSDCVLYTTLEPCLLCTAAVTHSHVACVRYAAPDPLWRGIRQLPELNDYVRRRWPTWDGPATGPVAMLAGVLIAQWYLRHDPDHAGLAAYAIDQPEVLAAAQRLGWSLDAFANRPLAEAFEFLWPVMVNAIG